MKRYTDVDYARLYCGKSKSAADRGIQFNLTFAQFKKLRKTKVCFYTGVPLTDDNFSIDRIDAALPYTAKNTVACDKSFNTMKGMLENPVVKGGLRFFLTGTEKLRSVL